MGFDNRKWSMSNNMQSAMNDEFTNAPQDPYAEDRMRAEVLLKRVQDGGLPTREEFDLLRQIYHSDSVNFAMLLALRSEVAAIKERLDRKPIVGPI